MEKTINKYADFGQHLKATRKLKYDDIKEFCEETGIPLKMMYDYESGRTFPPIERFVKICQCLDRSATYMLSPILKLSSIEQDIMVLFEDAGLKEIMRDQEVANMLRFTLFGFQLIHLTKKHFDYNGDMVEYLKVVKDKLFTEGQMKKLK